MKFVKAAGRRFAIVGELLGFLATNKRWWMVPMVVVLLAFGIVMALAQSSGIAPFIYTLF